MKENIKETAKSCLDEAFSIAKYLYENPELGYEEVKACEALCNSFAHHGFQVEKGIYDIPTAFRATFDSGKEGPAVALCAEYDALPEIGHGCGHNLISTMALVAALALAKELPQIGGKVVVVGTPAEETSGAKVLMAGEGEFDSYSVAMMAHPIALSECSGSSLTLIPLQFQYRGKAAHASACPEEGINALDAVIQLFNGINAIRQHVPKDVQFHGYISNGGVAPNIVPDFAEARFYIRAKRKATAEAAIEKVKKIAEGAALMTGATLEISSFEASYYDLMTNVTLRDAFSRNAAVLNDEPMPPQQGVGSLDMGNVSYRTPSIHAWVGFGVPGLIVHSKEFADMTVTEKGKDLLYRGACSMAMTGYDIITDPELLKNVRDEFEKAK